MSENQRATARLRGGIEVSIEALGDASVLEGPLWAINWFDRRVSAAYELYNLLAARSVLGVGGRPYVKMLRTSVGSGSAELGRETLLLVAYPSAQAFLEMLQTLWFQAISPLRELGVRRFIFGFAHRLDAPNDAIPKGRLRRHRGTEPHLVHVFDAAGERSEEYLAAAASAASDAGAELLFAGSPVARFALRRKGRDWRHAQLPLNGIAVYAAPDGASVARLESHSHLAALEKHAKASARARYRRVF